MGASIVGCFFMFMHYDNSFTQVEITLWEIVSKQSLFTSTEKTQDLGSGNISVCYGKMTYVMYAYSSRLTVVEGIDGILLLYMFFFR